MRKISDFAFETRVRGYGCALYFVDNESDEPDIRLGGFKSEEVAAEWLLDIMKKLAR